MLNKKKQIAKDIEKDCLQEAFNKVLLNKCEDKYCCNGINVNKDCPIVKVLDKKGFIGQDNKLPTCIDFATAMIVCKVDNSIK